MECWITWQVIMSLSKKILNDFEEEHGISLKKYGEIIDKKYEEKYRKEIEKVEKEITINLKKL